MTVDETEIADNFFSLFAKPVEWSPAFVVANRAALNPNKDQSYMEPNANQTYYR